VLQLRAMLRLRGIHLIVGLSLTGLAVGIVVLTRLFSSGSARLLASSPGDGADDVPITASIHLTFSEQMEASSVEAAFRVEPNVAGQVVGDDREFTFQPEAAWAPGTTYTVTLAGSAVSQRGRSLEETYSWRFSTRPPQLLYLGRPFSGAQGRQLYLAPLESASPRPLTDYPLGVWDYAVHPQGSEIVYSVLREDGGSDLWRMDRDGNQQRLLLACPDAACLDPAWSPDGRQLAYERRDIWAGAPNLDPKAGRIWLFDLEKGQGHPLFDYDVPLHSPVWAPEGGRLSYVSPVLPGLEVYDLRTDELQQFGSEWGATPVWSPDGTQLVAPELLLGDEALVVRLMRIDLAEGEAVDISGDEEMVKDVDPAWSPLGGWIAFGRQFLDEKQWTPGRQIWLTRPDGSEAYSLLTEPMSDQFAFSWRPDGGALAYLSSDLSKGAQPVPDVSVWIFDFTRQEPVFVADDGVLPKWLP
jgi:Tol biopolymer transport system component